MSEEFGTVSAKREKGREIEIMREQFRRHRETLVTLSADAPTEFLSKEYARLIKEIDLSLAKVDELEKRAGEPPTPSATQKHTEPGRRSLTPPPAMVELPPPRPRSSPWRLMAMMAAGLFVLGIIGFMLWRSSRDERPATPLTTEQEEVPAQDADGTISAVSPASLQPALAAQPETHDYGTIRKGTRAARQFEIANNTSEPISIEVARSTCRCLFYDYASVVPPKGKETITVTVDAARAREGDLDETVRVTQKGKPSVATTLQVTATVR